jgi:COMPASS component SWD2
LQPGPDGAGARVNSIAFHRSADLLVAAGDDDAIRVYDTEAGAPRPPLFSRKYGVANVCFAHDPAAVVYSSSKGADHAWRHHDLAANRYVRYFRGHAGRVTALCHSARTDQVLSAGEDKQVRLWDLRSGACSALLHAPGLPTVAHDEQGLVFCVGAESGSVSLYDARNYGAGPFASFVVEDERRGAALFALIRFSLDGRRLLAVAEGRVYVLDAFEGRTLAKLRTGVPDGGQAVEACLTADGRHVLSGCEDRRVRAWSVETGGVVAEWGAHPDRPACVKFSPRKMLVATACRALTLWALPPGGVKEER